MTSTETFLQYTPPASVDTQIKVFQQAVQLVEVDNTLGNEIDLNNASITAGFGFYEGTANDVKRQFALTHKGLPIFKRNFEGRDSTITNVTDNESTIHDHI